MKSQLKLIRKAKLLSIKIFSKKNLYFFVLFLISFLVSYILINKSKQSNQIISAAGEQTSSTHSWNEELPQPQKDQNTLSVLLLGYGGAGHQGGFLTDVIMLAHFDFDQKILGLISIPRDLWYQDKKVNNLLSFSNNSIDATRLKNSISQVTGIPINYYLGIDFVGFKRLIGQDLDSITVLIPETFEDPWYPITGEEVNPCGKTPEEISTLTATLSGFSLEKEFPCRYEQLYFPKGEMQMEGDDALKYVRSRHSSSDFARSERQKVVLSGIKNKIFARGFIENAESFYEVATKNISTDLDLESFKFVIPLLSTANDLQINNITLSTENVFQTSTSSTGAFILIPKENWQSVNNFINSQLTND